MVGCGSCQGAGAVAPTVGRGSVPHLAHPAGWRDPRTSWAVPARGPSSDRLEGAPDPPVRGQVLPVDWGGLDERSRRFGEIGQRVRSQQASFCDSSCLEVPHGSDTHRGCAASAVDGRLRGERRETSRSRRSVAGYAEPDGHIGAMRRHQLEPRHSVVALKAPSGRNAHPVLAPECTPCRFRGSDNDVWRYDCGFFIEEQAALFRPKPRWQPLAPSWVVRCARRHRWRSRAAGGPGCRRR